MINSRPHAGATAAALFALVMLSVASVRSIVMQASMTSPGSMATICGSIDASNASAVAMMDVGMQRAVAASTHNHHPGAPHPHQAACAYCAAAAHAPLLMHGLLVLEASRCAFHAYPEIASLGPRGPPAQPARARGPPIVLLTA